MVNTHEQKKKQKNSHIGTIKSVSQSNCKREHKKSIIRRQPPAWNDDKGTPVVVVPVQLLLLGKCTRVHCLSLAGSHSRLLHTYPPFASRLRYFQPTTMAVALRLIHPVWLRLFQRLIRNGVWKNTWIVQLLEPPSLVPLFRCSVVSLFHTTFSAA